MSTPERGGRFVVRRPLMLGRDAPGKLAARRISEHEVRAVLEDATVLVSAYEPDAGHGWTAEAIDRTIRGDGPEEPSR